MKYFLLILILNLFFVDVYSVINSTTTGGFFVEFGEDFSDYKKSISQIDYAGPSIILPKDSDIETDTVNYDFIFDMTNYSNDTRVVLFDGTTSNVVCLSSFNNNSIKTCDLVYNSNYISQVNYEFGFQLCNLDGVCKIFPNTFNLLQKDTAEFMSGGFHITFNLTYNNTGTIISTGSDSLSSIFPFSNFLFMFFSILYFFSL